LAQVLFTLKNLKEIDFDFEWYIFFFNQLTEKLFSCTRIDNQTLYSFGNSIAALKNLEKISLNFSG